MTLDSDKLNLLIQSLKRFLEGSSPGETEVLLDESSLEDINGIHEKLYMTNLNDNAVIIHYADEGDWTRAVLIPSSNFPYEEDLNAPVNEALEWFFEY